MLQKCFVDESDSLLEPLGDLRVGLVSRCVKPFQDCRPVRFNRVHKVPAIDLFGLDACQPLLDQQVDGCIQDLSEVKPSSRAEKLALEFSLQPEMAELILNKAERVFGGISGAVLTLMKGILTVNAGIDSKNAPPGCLILWPSDVERSARIFREEIFRRTDKKIGVLLVDSGLIPLRLGTCGLALAGAGFRPVADQRGKKDRGTYLE